MAIQIRRGQSSQFDPNKMLPGEFALTIDDRKLYICYGDGSYDEVAFIDDEVADGKIGWVKSENGVLYCYTDRTMTNLVCTATVGTGNSSSGGSGLSEAQINALISNGVANRESVSNKATSINEGNRNSNTSYPTVGAVTSYVDSKIPQGGNNGGSVTVDSELSTTSTNPVQNKVVAAEIGAIKEDLKDKANNGESYTREESDAKYALKGEGGSSVGGNIGSEARAKLINVLLQGRYNSVVFDEIKQLDILLGGDGNITIPDDEDTPTIPDTPATSTLSSISAVYTGGSVPVGTSVNSLTGITVTGTYSDSSVKPITGYTLSGNISNVGNNTITVSYGGKTTTITIVGVAQSQPEPEEPSEELFKDYEGTTAFSTGAGSWGTINYTESDNDQVGAFVFKVEGGKKYRVDTVNGTTYYPVAFVAAYKEDTLDIARLGQSNICGTYAEGNYMLANAGLKLAPSTNTSNRNIWTMPSDAKVCVVCLNKQNIPLGVLSVTEVA